MKKRIKVHEPKRLEKAKCFLPNYEMKIIGNGNVYLCCGAITEDLLIGNAGKETLSDIWHSKKAVDLRKLLTSGDLDRFKECVTCTLRYEYGESGNTVTDTVKGMPKAMIKSGV